MLSQRNHSRVWAQADKAHAKSSALPFPDSALLYLGVTKPANKCNPEMQRVESPIATPRQWGEEQMGKSPDLYPQ